MIVSEVQARHMPVKVLGLEVERKNVGQQYGEGAADVTDCVCAEIGRSCKRGIATLQCRAHLYASYFRCRHATELRLRRWGVTRQIDWSGSSTSSVSRRRETV